ncbi:HNH endonuclease [Mariniluteicoccus flavus]
MTELILLTPEWVHDVAGQIAERVVAAPREPAACVDVLRELEDLKSAACAAQAIVTAHLAGRHTDGAGRGVSAEVGLARRESPAVAARLMEAAVTLTDDMEHTLGALLDGRLNERRAMVVVRETAALSPETRAEIDTHLGTRLDADHGLGDRQIAEEVRNLAYALDPEGAQERADEAYARRRVVTRPGPDTTTTVTAHLSTLQGAAVHAALSAAADSARLAGDPRARSQVMADTLVARVTGDDAAVPGKIELSILMTDETLLGQSDRPAVVDGQGPVPARWIRQVLSDAEDDVQVALRRLYRPPGRTIAMETSSRLFTPGMKKLVRWRDGMCRTPWCSAAIRQYDHVVSHAGGGPSSEANQQGLCEQCNQAKEALGWTSLPRADGSIRTTTPTGHAYEAPREGPLQRLTGPTSGDASPPEVRAS